MQKRMIVGKKRRQRHYPILKVVGGIVGLLLLLLIWGMMPRYQSIRYGVCKTYIEMNVLYPQHLEFTYVEETVPPPRYLPVVRVYYKKIGPFGEQLLDFAECTFRPDSTYGFALDSVNINRERFHPAEDLDKVDRYNKTIPIVVLAKPDLTSPPYLPDDVAEYK